MADNVELYYSRPDSIALARTTMRDLREALTTDAEGKLPAKFAEIDWDGLNMQPPEVAWQDMNAGQRYDLLRHALDESIWSLEGSPKWDEPRDSQKLANEFVDEDQRQATPPGRANTVASLKAQLDVFADEFARLAGTDDQAALAEKFGKFVYEAYEVIAWLAEARPTASRDAFDHAVTNLRQLWYGDGYADGMETWEEQSAVEKVGYLAKHAAAHNVSFERFVDAAGRTLDLAPGQEFTADEVQHLLRQIRWALGDYSEDYTGIPPHAAPQDRVPSPGEIAENVDDLPTPEESRKLQSEWTHDYGLRRMEDRGVKYEDEAERRLDHAPACSKGQDRTGEQQRKRVPSPGEIGRNGRRDTAEYCPEPDSGHENGRGR